MIDVAQVQAIEQACADIDADAFVCVNLDAAMELIGQVRGDLQACEDKIRTALFSCADARG
jgi:hypothetical protein